MEGGLKVVSIESFLIEETVHNLPLKIAALYQVSQFKG